VKRAGRGTVGRSGRRARVLSGVAAELVVGERSGRRIVGCWAVAVSFSPSKAMYASSR
jgi:hypothetical protein